MNTSIARQPRRNDAPIAARPKPWYFEAEVVLLVLLVAGVYFSRLTALSIRGEESRWARVAWEMLETGDWIVPRQQGEIFADRPPLNSWCMALAGLATGRLGPAEVRLPAAMATLLTTLLVYGYSRMFLSRGGALAAGAVFATLPQVMQLGRLAESDAVLTLCASASMLVWHAGYARKWPPACTWIAGYSLAALAGLAKGPQGPLYFVGAVWLFLVIRRDWRYLPSFAHLAGLAVLAGVIAAWLVPFYWSAGGTAVAQVWSEGGFLSKRVAGIDYGPLAKHLVTYPVEVFTCLLPWSVLLAAFASRKLRQSLDAARPHVVFLATCLVVAFPTCWIVPEARARYFMSLYPCVACLVGVVVDRCLAAQAASTWWEKSWGRFLVTVAAFMVAGAVLGFGRTFSDTLDRYMRPQPPWFTLCYALAAAALGAIAVWASSGTNLAKARAGVLAVAAFMGLNYTGVAVNALRASSENAPAAVATLKQQIPEGQRLVSFGPLHHLFTYYYQAPIEIQPLPTHASQVDPGVRYFCFMQVDGNGPPPLPFAWKSLAAISCDRNRRDDPRAKVVVGLRLEPVVTAARPGP